MRVMKLGLIVAMGLVIGGGGVTTAQAAKRVKLAPYPIDRIMTFKAKNTKVYSYPRASHPYSKYLGKNKSIKRTWTLTKVVRIKGKRYGKLRQSDQIPLQHGSVGRGVVWSHLNSGYVLLSKLRSHKKIQSYTTMKKTAYWLPNQDQDFWDMPAGTVGNTSAVEYGRDLAYQTIYAFQTLTTVTHHRYLNFKTAKGQEIGWLPADAVYRGTYSDPLKRELARDLPDTTTKTTVVNRKRNLRVGVAKRDGAVQRVVIVDEWSETTTIDFKDGLAVKKLHRLGDGTKTQVKDFATPKSKVTFSRLVWMDGYVDDYVITVTATGKVSSTVSSVAYA
ncbi:GW dipeptide domain-containing protein [Levilactobacillus humaensis]|uniref:GW dipeptide domain-containing protein n=1 Tax=Levilactobacillus humaensis TaxID=2950375 RepID=UPI0021C49FFC|nr:GW dipeptide domain-containing protein [Levilactobacillus humaensis]